MDDWQPIETAPLAENMFDMKLVDLWSGNSRFPNCFYDDATGKWLVYVRYLTNAGHRKTVYNVVKNPTHWRWPPDPPSLESQINRGDVPQLEEV